MVNWVSLIHLGIGDLFSDSDYLTQKSLIQKGLKCPQLEFKYPIGKIIPNYLLGYSSCCRCILLSKSIAQQTHRPSQMN